MARTPDEARAAIDLTGPAYQDEVLSAPAHTWSFHGSNHSDLIDDPDR